MRAGLGFEYTPSKKLEDPLYKRISYRIGGSYTANYLSIRNENINTIGLGTGFRFRSAGITQLDLYFKYNVTRKNSNALIKDEVFRLGASVKIGEMWFLKPSDDF